ncbi:oxidoreductase domain protein [Arthrobacter sp. Hiyo8]|nr:oxidoreductase domain protein [Arthrobacter sp. Hiyo8]
MGPYYVTALVQAFGSVRRVAAVGSKAKDVRVVGSGPKAGEEFPVEVPPTSPRCSSSKGRVLA